jgi:DNA-binding NarL/FixJ family response regulator
MMIIQNSMKIRVGLCEDDAFTIFSLSSALSATTQIQVAFSALDASQAIIMASNRMPHAVVIDLDLGPGPNGMDLARNLRLMSPGIGIIFLTCFEAPRLLERKSIGLPSGSQYLVKKKIVEVGEIVRSIKKSIAKRRKTLLPTQGPLQSLTDHQLNVLELLTLGRTNADIALELGISSKSVEATIGRMVVRLGLNLGPAGNQRIQLANAFIGATGSRK